MYFIRELVVDFWNPKIWLPPGTTWGDFKSDDKVTYADYKHMLIAVPAAVILLLVRYLVEKNVLSPFGVYLGIPKATSKPPHNEVLESFYRRKRKPEHEEITNLANETKWAERRIQRWFRYRQAADKPSLLKKFSECVWKFLYYTYSSVYGTACLWDKPWLWDITHCWYGYPFHPITQGCLLYYIHSLAFYLSLTASHFFDVKRKDFWQMFAHHIVTVTLLFFSWTCHLHRIGTLVVLLHDLADIFVELTKAAKFAGYQRVSDFCFVTLTMTWLLTRLIAFPFWIIHSALITAPKLAPLSPAYYVLVTLLIILAVFNFIWAYFIFNIAICMYKAGYMVKDVRSSTEGNTSDENSATVQVKQRHRRRV